MAQLTSSHQRGITGHHSRATDLLGDLHLPALPGLAGTAMMTFAPYTPDFLRRKCLEDRWELRKGPEKEEMSSAR